MRKNKCAVYALFIRFAVKRSIYFAESLEFYDFMLKNLPYRIFPAYIVVLQIIWYNRYII